MGVGPVLGDLWQMVVFEKVERCLSTVSKTASLNGMVLQGLGDGRVRMYTHRVVALFDVWWCRWQTL